MEPGLLQLRPRGLVALEREPLAGDLQLLDRDGGAQRVEPRRLQPHRQAAAEPEGGARLAVLAQHHHAPVGAHGRSANQLQRSNDSVIPRRNVISPNETDPGNSRREPASPPSRTVMTS